jgi:hypothetical protein
MKIFSGGAPLKRSQAKNCLLVNQFATPGLGSLMGGRIWEGLLQLLLAVGGFVLVMLWFVQFFMGMIQSSGESTDGTGHPQYAQLGAVLFIASWLLSWITSMSLLRNALPDDLPAPNAPPPRPLPPKLR